MTAWSSFRRHDAIDRVHGVGLLQGISLTQDTHDSTRTQAYEEPQNFSRFIGKGVWNFSRILGRQMSEHLNWKRTPHQDAFAPIIDRGQFSPHHADLPEEFATLCP